MQGGFCVEDVATLVGLTVISCLIVERICSKQRSWQHVTVIYKNVQHMCTGALRAYAYVICNEQCYNEKRWMFANNVPY